MAPASTKSTRIHKILFRLSWGILVLPLVAMVGLDANNFFLDWPVGSFKNNCLDCHGVHNAGGGGFLLGGFATINGLCLSCHAESANNANAPDVKTHQSFMCNVCHDSHNRQGLNLKHVKTSVVTAIQGPATVIFETRNDFADGDATRNGICEVCHSTTKYHRYNGPGPNDPHNYGADCATCHDHNAAFAGAGGCTDCHNAVKGSGTHAAGTLRRQIISNAGVGGDFQDGQLGGHLTGTDPTNFECVVCHREGYVDTGVVPNEVKVDVAYHNAGTAPYAIDLRNVDDANASWPVKTDPTSWPAASSPNHGGTWTTPTNQYKRNLTQFCLHCHDADGASVTFTKNPSSPGTGLDPFGRGTAPLDTVTQFKTTNFSTHAIASTEYTNLGPKYTADFPTDPNGIKPGTFVNGWHSNSATECADCHLGQEDAGTPTYYHNAHGGKGLQWLLLDKNGLDKALTHGSSGDEDLVSTVLCYKCHDPVDYASDGSGLESRYEKHDQNGHSSWTSNVFGIGCLNCHGGDTRQPVDGTDADLVKGGIHGTNRSDNGGLDRKGVAIEPYDRVRFTNGAALDYWMDSSGSVTCSAQGRPAFGHNIDCTQHGSQSYTRRY